MLLNTKPFEALVSTMIQSVKESTGQQTSTSYCTFHVGHLLFGVEIKRVQEVLRHHQTTIVPLAGPQIGGLMNLRGQIVTTLDLRRKLDVFDDLSDHLPKNVVLRSPEGPVSLLVDEIGDVLELENSQLKIPPETIPDNLRETITGVYQLEESLMLVLNASILDPTFLQSNRKKLP